MAATEPPAGGERVTVVIVGSTPGLAPLRQILGHTSWTVREAPDLSDAKVILREVPEAVYISDAELPDGTWKDLLDETHGLPLPPPVIVTTRFADDDLWMEVLNCGGYNVLAFPFQQREVFRTISTAWLRRRGQQPPARLQSASYY